MEKKKSNIYKYKCGNPVSQKQIIFYLHRHCFQHFVLIKCQISFEFDNVSEKICEKLKHVCKWNVCCTDNQNANKFNIEKTIKTLYYEDFVFWICICNAFRGIIIVENLFIVLRMSLRISTSSFSFSFSILLPSKSISM